MKKRQKKLILIFLTIIAFFPTHLRAKSVWSIKSSVLHRNVPVEIYMPSDYIVSKTFPLVYLLHGYSENYTQWGKITDCQQLADEYQMIIICPEGYVSFYLDSSVDYTSHYESFFFQELVPKVHRELSVDKNNIFISGLSMGGYGALRLFIRHPQYFNTAGSTSGAVDMDYSLFLPISMTFWGNTRMTDDLAKVLGPPIFWKDNSISSILRDDRDFHRDFIFDCGKEDPLFMSSKGLKDSLDKWNIPATFITGPGTHNWDYWKKSIPHHFIFFKQHLKN